MRRLSCVSANPPVSGGTPAATDGFRIYPAFHETDAVADRTKTQGNSGFLQAYNRKKLRRLGKMKWEPRSLLKEPVTVETASPA